MIKNRQTNTSPNRCATNAAAASGQSAAPSASDGTSSSEQRRRTIALKREARRRANKFEQAPVADVAFEWLDVREAAELVRVSRQTIHGWIRLGMVEHRRVGRRYVVRTAGVRAAAAGEVKP